MQSQWSAAEAERLVGHYAARRVDRDVALRVYTSRLLGGDPKLVLHGGGNTSVKTVVKDLLDEDAEVLCVKGSGWDMAAIEPAGLPAVRLRPLRKLRAKETLSDEEMVRVQRANLIDPSAPNPSVETLLHAFLPHKFVDHTHSTAVLSIADQPDARERCADLYEGRLGLVPYIMPGFQLAKKAVEVFEADPSVVGLVLLKHGIFTFGDTAREAYERMIEAVTLAEERLERRRNTIVFPAASLPRAVASVAEIAPILRGACAIPSPVEKGAYKRFILEFRTSPLVLDYIGGAELTRYSQAGVATPDHTLRTKNYPLIVPPPQAGRLNDFKTAVNAAVEQFVADYHAYFARHNARQAVPKRELDPMPRVILVPGLGLFGLGPNARDARIAADIAESTVETVTDAEAVGRFAPVGEADMFDIEYWSLEQAKLGQEAQKPLGGQVAVVTGGAGTIGCATAAAMARAGAELAVLDIDGDAAAAAAKKLAPTALGLACDVTDPASVRASFDGVAAHFGGVDIVVSNAGAAWQGRIGEVEDAVLRKSFELNFFAHQTVAQNAVRIMLAQGTGGCLLFNVSRQAISQGPNAGPYGLPKAATLFLMKQYALEYGADGIRSNAVNADGIRSGIMTSEYIKSRAAAYSMSEAAYMSRNLLGREVTADDVAQAFLHLALARNTSSSFLTVDGGNLAAAPR
ncbi:MAG: bifunctional aldolase/short-chain dehydrogenase [Alphaproteobacteria bacterium]|nr:bifunctional aldolase/short-chain dehydrogenase [Alphaproteobacteria bacterium]